jgi:hypothetical protein
MRFPGLGSWKSPEKEIPAVKTVIDRSLRDFEQKLAEERAEIEKAIHSWIIIDSEKKYPVAMNAFLKSVLENENQDLSIYTGETDVLRLPDESIELLRELAQKRIVRALLIGDPKITSWRILLDYRGENVDVRTPGAHMKTGQHSVFSGDSFISSSKPAPFLKKDVETAKKTDEAAAGNSKKKDIKDSGFMIKDLSFHHREEVASLKKAFDLRFESAERISK